MKKEIKGEEAHSKIGASSANRWFNCPGSIEACKDIPKTTSEWALVGTIAHGLAEECLKSLVNPTSFVNKKIKIDGKKVLIDKEMAEAVQVYFEVIKEDLHDYFPAGVPMRDQNDAFFIEQKFHITDVDKDAYGRNDACLAEMFSVLRIYDYKHGKGVPVDVKENKQLMYYALGALQELGAAEEDYPEIELVIVQPRANHPDGPVRKWTLSYAKLMEFKAELIKAIKRTKVKKPVLNAGSWCRFCDAKTHGCPAIAKQAVSVAQEQFQTISTTETPFTMTAPDKMTPEELQKVLDAGQIISDWVTGCQREAHSRAEKGGKIPGYKLVKKKSNRVWGDADQVVEAFSEEYGLDVYNMKIKSPAQLEKIVPKDKLEEFIIKPDTGTSLVAQSDRRTEVAPAVETQFKPVK